VIGVTAYHLIYTIDRGWVEASQLRMGEVVEGADGNLSVTGLVQDPGVFQVYNMDVEADHVYYVGELPALVHNVCGEDEPDWEDTGWESKEEALAELRSQQDNIRIWEELGNGQAAASAARTLEYMEAFFEQVFGEPPDLL
jgi:hypothetical protein